MADEITLDFIGHQLQRVLEELASVRDQMLVQTAICSRLDASVQGLTQEIIALRSMVLRHQLMLQEART